MPQHPTLTLTSTGGGLKLARSERTDRRRFDLYEADVTPEVYVDGISKVMLGSAVSKIGFHVVAEVFPEEGEPSPVEKRILQITVAIPTVSLMEGILNIGAALSESIDNFESDNVGRQILDKIKETFSTKSE